jgi:hypothetical protein
VLAGVEELALVDQAVGIARDAGALDDAIDPVALVGGGVRIGDRALPMGEVVAEAPDIDRAVGIGHLTLPLDPALAPLADIDVAVDPGERAVAVAAVVQEIALVDIAVGIDHPALCPAAGHRPARRNRHRRWAGSACPGR